MRIVGLLRCKNAFAGPQLAGHPQSFQVGKSAAACQVAKVGFPAEHTGNGAYRFHLHRRAGAAAIQRMIVRVQKHGKRIGSVGDGVGRLEHLARVKRMEVRVVVRQSLRYPLEHRNGSGVCRCAISGRKGVKGPLQRRQGLDEQREHRIIRHICPAYGAISAA